MKHLLFSFFLVLAVLSSAQEQKPNVVLITLDTFRADNLEAYGAKKDIAPNLNQFAKEAQVYINSITPSPLTLPAHATIMTGCFPARTALFDNGVGVLSPSIRSLPEVLRENGYITRAYVSAKVLKRRYGLSRGFDIYDDEVGPEPEGRRIGGEVTQRALFFLKEKKAKPFFLWIHYFDTHSPYTAPLENDPVVGDYYKAVTYVDGQVGTILNSIPPNTIIVIVSDHGEALGDHGELTHGILMYQPTTSVVIMVRGEKFSPSLIKQFRTSADVAPTLLKAIGLDYKTLDGKPLDSDGARMLPLSTLLPLDEYRWKPLFGATDGRYKWIKGDKLRLFDLLNDPKETVDISNVAPKESLELKKFIPSFDTAYRTMAKGSFSGLGYLTGVPQGDIEISKLKDPEDMLKVFEVIEKVRILREKDDWEASTAMLKATIPLDPGNPSLLFAMGDGLRHQNKADEALKYLDDSLNISPALSPSWVSKGCVFLAKNNKEEAARCFEKALSYDEDSIEALNPLAAYYLDLNKPQLAFPLIEGAISRGIANSDTYIMQGRIHLIQNKIDDAKIDFGSALRVSPNPKVTLKSIADIYLMRGFKDIAVAIFKEGIKNYPEFPDNYLTLGAYYLSAEKYEEAYALFEKAQTLQLSPADKENVAQIVTDLGKALGEAKGSEK
jgi:tetratricopeptide (TPR) repeat protein